MVEQQFWNYWLEAQELIDDLHNQFNQADGTDGTDDTIVESLSDTRLKLNNLIEGIKASLGKKYDANVLFYGLFPLLCYCDEKINFSISNSLCPSMVWDTLQSEHFQRKDGGDHFYFLLDQVLLGQMKPPMFLVVAQAIILKSGFRGRYHIGNQVHIKVYLEKIEQYLLEQVDTVNVSEVESMLNSTSPKQALVAMRAASVITRISHKEFYYTYFGISIFMLIIVYVVLFVI